MHDFMLPRTEIRVFWLNDNQWSSAFDTIEAARAYAEASAHLAEKRTNRILTRAICEVPIGAFKGPQC